MLRDRGEPAQVRQVGDVVGGRKFAPDKWTATA
jgi:hypothetical protein